MFGPGSIAPPPSQDGRPSSFLSKIRSHPLLGPLLSMTSVAVKTSYPILRNMLYFGFVPGVLIMGTRTDGAPSLQDLPMKIIVL